MGRPSVPDDIFRFLLHRFKKLSEPLIINGPDSFNGITKRVSVRVKLIKTKPKETQ